MPYSLASFSLTNKDKNMTYSTANALTTRIDPDVQGDSSNYAELVY